MHRFSYQTESTPFSWSNPSERDEFIEILCVFDDELAAVLGEKSELSAQAELRHAATFGVLDLIVKLLSGAAQNAVSSGASRIEQRHLAKAYIERIALDRDTPTQSTQTGMATRSIHSLRFGRATEKCNLEGASHPVSLAASHPFSVQSNALSRLLKSRFGQTGKWSILRRLLSKAAAGTKRRRRLT